MVKCILIENGLCVRPSGRVDPCCKFKIKIHDGVFVDQNYNDFLEKYVEKLKSDWIDECQECYNDELDNTVSLRQSKNQELDNNNFSGRWYWDLKLHNTCNLACRMCSQNDSSTWKKIVTENRDQPWSDYINSFEKKESKYGWHKSLPDLLKNVHEVRYLKFTGGEPLMIPAVKTVLKAVIDSGIADQVTLQIVTNLTFPIDTEWQSILDKFKNLRIIVSANGIESRYEYIRAGANWNSFIKNVDDLKSYIFHKSGHNEFHISELTQMLTVTKKSEIDTFWKAREINCNWGSLYDPKYYSLAAMSPEKRQQFQIVSNTKYDPQMWEEFVRQSLIHDKIYNTDLYKEAPELF
jgi:organic radical activating enzyme